MTAISTSWRADRATPEPDEKFAHRRRRLVRLFHLYIVTGACNDDDGGATDVLTEKPRVLWWRELIFLATDGECRCGHRRDPGHDVEGVARLQIPEHHAGRIVRRRAVQRRPQIRRHLGADREAHEQLDALRVVAREKVEQPRQHAQARPGAYQAVAIHGVRIGQGKLLPDRHSLRLYVLDYTRE